MIASVGRQLYQGWMVIAGHFGEIQTLLIVCLVYLVAVGPAAIVTTVARRDLLAKRDPDPRESAWQAADSTARPDLERAARLF